MRIAITLFLISHLGCTVPSEETVLGQHGISHCLGLCDTGCQALGSACYSDGQFYCSDCVAACHGQQPVACVPPEPPDAGNPEACVRACPVGCGIPGSVCYSDGRFYCSACSAACYGQTPVACAKDGGS